MQQLKGRMAVLSALSFPIPRLAPVTTQTHPVSFPFVLEAVVDGVVAT